MGEYNEGFDVFMAIKDDIADFVFDAVKNGKPVGIQGKDRVKD
jgi:hypothetical protein